jgi:methylenetetrahydrofolate dehydrogenase (NADP+)/methenyltetrahydrofolate cyclohydrolase
MTTAQLIDGVALSQQLRADVAAAPPRSRPAASPRPGRDLVGDNPASQVYVRNKVKACQDTGMHSVLEKYEADLTEAELLARVDALNNDPTIHGILVQLPLPKPIDAHKVIEAISPAKDVDGFHVASAGAVDDRHARLLALHALWLHEDAGIHRLRLCVANMRWSLGAATSLANPWH